MSNIEAIFWNTIKSERDKENYTNDFIEFCRKTFPFHKGTIRLEVGCGPHNSFHIKDKTLIGIDPLNDSYVKQGWGEWCTRVICLDGGELPFPDNSWEIVYCLNVLDHTTKQKKLIREIHRVMKEGGTLYFYTDLREEDNKLHYRVSKREVDSMFEVFTKKELIYKPESIIHKHVICVYGVLIK